jgi:hypothetical protein
MDDTKEMNLALQQDGLMMGARQGMLALKQVEEAPCSNPRIPGLKVLAKVSKLQVPLQGWALQGRLALGRPQHGSGCGKE